MAEVKVGFRAVFHLNDEVKFYSPLKESYDQAESEIFKENKQGSIFTHAQVEKVYYRH